MKKIYYNDFVNCYVIRYSGVDLILNPACEDALIGGNIHYWLLISGTNWAQRNASLEPQAGTSYFSRELLQPQNWVSLFMFLTIRLKSIMEQICNTSQCM